MTRCWYSATVPGQLVVIRLPSMYQLSQPAQALSASRSWISASYAGGDLGAHVEQPAVAGGAAAGDLGGDLGDVAGLRLHHVDDRAAAEVGVRPVDEEQVGEAGHAQAEVGARAVGPGARAGRRRRAR